MSGDKPLHELTDDELMGMGSPSGADAASPASDQEDADPSRASGEGLDRSDEDLPDTPEKGNVGEAVAAEGSEAGGTAPSAEQNAVVAAGDAAEGADTGEAATSVPGSSEDSEEGQGSSDTDAADEDAAQATAVSADTEVDYRGEYNRLLAPFRASGREMRVENVDEAIRLMQMGADYTRKMQGLKPGLKVVRMLESHDLLDEGKLGFLIDLHARKPGAIQKLVRESNIDPMDLNDPAAPEYKPGSHQISDAEMAFHEILGDVSSAPGGGETITHIDQTWDQASKERAFEEPEIVKIIHDQRASGIYEVISAEVERQRTLGIIGPNVPFLTAYKTVGDHLHQNGQLAQRLQPPPGQPGANPAPTSDAGQTGVPSATPLETRPAKQSADTPHARQARAASPARGASRTPANKAAPINPLTLSDDEIMGMAAPR